MASSGPLLKGFFLNRTMDIAPCVTPGEYAREGAGILPVSVKTATGEPSAP